MEKHAFLHSQQPPLPHPRGRKPSPSFPEMRPCFHAGPPALRFAEHPPCARLRETDEHCHHPRDRRGRGQVIRTAIVAEGVSSIFNLLLALPQSPRSQGLPAGHLPGAPGTRHIMSQSKPCILHPSLSLEIYPSIPLVGDSSSSSLSSTPIFTLLGLGSIQEFLSCSFREFPGGPVVRTRHFHCWVPGSIPGRGTKIPQAAAQPGKKKKKVASS